MKLDNNLILICATIIISIHMIMKGLFDIVSVKNAGQVISNNFEEVLKNMKKINNNGKINNVKKGE